MGGDYLAIGVWVLAGIYLIGYPGAVWYEAYVQDRGKKWNVVDVYLLPLFVAIAVGIPLACLGVMLLSLYFDPVPANYIKSWTP